MDSEGVKFVLMVNKQGHTRFSKWMQHVEDDPHRRRMMEYELVRKCMPRDVDHVRTAVLGPVRGAER